LSGSPKRILIIAVPGFGDVLLCTPLIHAVRKKWPEADLHVMLRTAAASILEGNPDVEGVVGMTPRAGTIDTLRLLAPRFRDYDLIISNATSDRTTFYSLMLGRRRVSMVLPQGKTWQRSLNHAYVEIDENDRHVMESTRLLGEAAGVNVGHKIVNPFSPDSHAVITGHLGEDWRQQPYAVIHPSASLPVKHWNRAGWQAVVDRLRMSGLHVIVTGGPGDGERRYIIDELGLGESSTTCLVGCLRLAHIAELLASAKLYVGVDTLVSHIAAATAAPVVVLFGPSNPVKWGPWPFGHEAEVSPYNKRASQRVGNVYLVCDTSGSLDRLTGAEVLGAIETMLGES
jgi:heptosyltransferase-3